MKDSDAFGGKELIFVLFIFSFWEDIDGFCTYLSSLEVLNLSLQVNSDPANRCWLDVWWEFS